MPSLPRSVRLPALAVAAAALGAVIVGVWPGAPPDAGPAAPAATSSPPLAVPRPAVAAPAEAVAQAAVSGTPVSPPAVAVAGQVADEPVPPGIERADWARLQRDLGRGSPELQRVADYLEWADAARRLRAAAAGSPERLALAGVVGAGLDARLARGEIHAGEALMWQRTLLETTVPDAAERQRRLDDWVASQPGGALRAAAADPRQAEFERRQGELLARLGPGTDAPTRTAALDALRQEVFGTARR